MSKDILSETRAELEKNQIKPGSEGEELTVEPTKIGFMMNNLSDLYIDGEYAAFRETLANAMDSHLGNAKNNDDYIEVTFPKNTDDDLLTIQDKGRGMSREELITRLLRFGNSSKSDSTEEAGEYGYGAKSPLAAAPWFKVYSVQDGIRNSFTVKKIGLDQNAAPRYFWDEDCLTEGVPTDEPNGVRISYPMKVSHKYDYYERRYRFMSWKPTPFQVLGLPINSIKFDGEIHENSIHNEELFTTVKGGENTLAWVKNNLEEIEDINPKSLYVELGSVIYKIRDSVVESSNAMKLLRSWDRLIILHANIRLIEVTPSRDSLRYSDKTLDNLKALADEIVDVLKHKKQLEINRLDSKGKALSVYSSLVMESYPGTTNLAYREEGNLKLAVDEILELQPSSGNRGILFGKWRNNGNRRTKLEWSKVDEKTIHKVLSIGSSLGVYTIGYAGDETTVKAAFRKAFRNADILSRFAVPNANPNPRTQPNEDTVILVTSLISLPVEENEEMEKLGVHEEEPNNKWWEECFASKPNLDDSIIDARIAFKAYNKEHNIQPVRQTVAAAARGQRAMFTVLEFDEDGVRYTLTPHDSLNDLLNMGEYYIFSEGGTAFDYSVIDFSEESHGSGDVRQLPLAARALYKLAQTEDRAVIVRTSRQRPLDTGKSWSHVHLREFVIEKFVNKKVPSITPEEILFFAKHAASYSLNYEIIQLVKNAISHPNTYSHPNDSLLASTVRSFNESVKALTEDEVKELIPENVLDLMGYGEIETAAELHEKYTEQFKTFRNAWYVRYTGVGSSFFYSKNEDAVEKAKELIDDANQKINENLLLVKSLQAIAGGREKLGDELFDRFMTGIKLLSTIQSQ